MGTFILPCGDGAPDGPLGARGGVVGCLAPFCHPETEFVTPHKVRDRGFRMRQQRPGFLASLGRTKYSAIVKNCRKPKPYDPTTKTGSETCPRLVQSFE